MDVKRLASFCQKVGIAYKTAEEYGGLAGFYDWGVRGAQIKKNVKDVWWSYFVERNELIGGMDGSIITHPKVWEASGHVGEFHDPIVKCTKCGNVYRADHLVEDVKGVNAEGLSLEELAKILKDVKCPSCGGELGDVSYFNLMFSTKVGPYEGTVSYLRPETAQLIFVDFPEHYIHMRKRLPFGIAQMGKAYRNEISPRGFLFRLREFEQMEIEFFFDPENDESPFYREIKHTKVRAKPWKGEEDVYMLDDIIDDYKGREWMIYWIYHSLKFFELVGVDMDRVRIRQQSPEERAHYSMDTWDVEFYFDDMGWKEIEGIAHRSDYDLSRHRTFSKSDKYVVRMGGRSFVPWVVEPSWGVERTILAILYSSYREDEERVWLDLKPWIAPVQVAVFPLLSRDNLPEEARRIYYTLRALFRTEYDEGGSIGKRYRRYDEIGTPYAVTVDYQTLEDKTVTVRERNTMKQERVGIDELLPYLGERMRWT